MPFEGDASHEQSFQSPDCAGRATVGPEWGGARPAAGWAEDGQLKAITNIWGGLDTAPAALVAILAGENVGQVVVRVSSHRT